MDEVSLAIPTTITRASTRMPSTRITVPTMPMIMPARAEPSPPSPPWEALMSLRALRPSAHANGATRKPMRQANPPASPTMPRTSESVACGWSGRGALKA